MFYIHPMFSYFTVHNSDTWICDIQRTLASFKFRESL